MEHPRKRYLGVGRIFLYGKPMQQIEYGPVGLDILFRQLGNEFPYVIEAELLLCRYLTRKEPACNRRERYDSCLLYTSDAADE